jgi:ADP-dependent NAD(P)H-hydrate dehydratase / NAD(P)H-hydrate epimerase
MELEEIFSDAQNRDLDRYTIEELGIPGSILMGMAASSIFQEYVNKFSKNKVIILAGSGNNGGDGLALGILFFCQGKEVKIYRKKGKHSTEYLFYLQKAEALGIHLEDLSAFIELAKQPFDSLLIDCLLGTGFSPPLQPELQSIITVLNQWKINNPESTILSIDTLSGYHLDKGNTCFVKADYLAEIGVKKITNLFAQKESKETSFHPIAFPIQNYLMSHSNPYKLFQKKSLSAINQIRSRNQNSHKYSNGSAYFVGGSRGMSGAILLAQKSFHSTGGGYSKVISPSLDTIEAGLKSDPSLIYSHWQNDFERFEWEKAKCIVMGPGLRTEDINKGLDFFLNKDKFLILDAGALDMIGNITLNQKTLLTPHKGEFQSLLGKKLHSEQQFIDELENYAIDKKAYIMLKGMISILATPNGTLYFFDSPNPKLAVMGTGDLLCGILAFFIGKLESIEEGMCYALSYMHLSLNMNSYPTAESIRKFLEDQ